MAFSEGQAPVSRKSLCRLGRTSPSPIGAHVVRRGILGRAKHLLSRKSRCRLGRSLALPESRKGVCGPLPPLTTVPHLVATTEPAAYNRARQARQTAQLC